MKRFLKDYVVTALCAILWALIALPAHADTFSDREKAVRIFETEAADAQAEWHSATDDCLIKETKDLRR